MGLREHLPAAGSQLLLTRGKGSVQGKLELVEPVRQVT